MVSRLEQLLEESGLNRLFDRTKETMVEAVWTYVQGFHSVNDTEPPPHTLRTFIWETIRFLPEVIDLYCVFDAPKETKDEMIKYVIDKFYHYVFAKLQELHRARVEPEV